MSFKSDIFHSALMHTVKPDSKKKFRSKIIFTEFNPIFLKKKNPKISFHEIMSVFFSAPFTFDRTLPFHEK